MVLVKKVLLGKKCSQGEFECFLLLFSYILVSLYLSKKGFTSFSIRSFFLTFSPNYLFKLLHKPKIDAFFKFTTKALSFSRIN